MASAPLANTIGKTNHRLWPLILRTLRVTVALQCLGNWRWLTQIEETSLLHWMLNPIDVGGLAWSESTALAVQQVVGWLTLLAGGLVLWRPLIAVLAPLVLLQSLITVAMWQLADGYVLDVPWISPQLLTLFPFATQLARIAAPLALLLLCSVHTETPASERRVISTMQLLRWALAIVFLAHGIEAWQQNPIFLDLLINATQRQLGISLSQAVAEQCLTVLGAIDILVAIACVSLRSLSVLWWMTLWGGLTVLGRVAANGWEISWHEALTRIPHFGLPLAVVLWWHLLRSTPDTTLSTEDLIDPAAGSKISATRLTE